MASIIGVETLQHTNGTTAATIDSSGRIQQPNLVAFKAGRSAGAVNNNTDIVFDYAYYNNGNHYSTTTGKFTAPVDGVYVLTFNILTNPVAGSQDDIGIYKNNTSTVLAKVRSHGDRAAYNTVSTTIVENLSANDTVYARVINGEVYGASAEWTQFSGYQIA